MILISDQTPELMDVLGALQSFLGNLKAKTVIVIDGQSELIKALLDAKKIDYVEAPGTGLANAPAFDLGAGLRKATPIATSDWVKEPEVVAPPAEKGPMKVCKACGRGFTGRKGDYCSKACYQREYMRQYGKKPPAQNTSINMISDERIQENIDRIVANAKDQPEGANLEKTMMAHGQTLKVRKLG